MANLLLVHDGLDRADALADVLRVHGDSVCGARDGTEGLASPAAQEPDVIRCDVEMPIMTGPDMASEGSP